MSLHSWKLMLLSVGVFFAPSVAPTTIATQSFTFYSPSGISPSGSYTTLSGNGQFSFDWSLVQHLPPGQSITLSVSDILDFRASGTATGHIIQSTATPTTAFSFGLSDLERGLA